ncbi:uncharacterized protein (TIGR02246 family) [Caulobacter ginsengisoli]|uniref:Uncharacterized protein (TIGR02246 family) n=1 Tax=Caulobacter ginsengisoli TaxID=400775 RepID=A0ABU0IT39_9CAUL|nr:nuclear transport factor 2 family protein [Caulobacter ginsengisoli]MDQ0464204.1 uncharacterized protein (TIGR02246 family) [Caulobacter ginsengisoli]
MATATLEHPTLTESALKAVFDRYHVGWETQDAALIASLHSADSVFLLHDGSPAVVGRETIRRHVEGLFARYPALAFEPEQRTLFGQNRWVFDYVMVLGSAGKTARVPMVDVVDVNADGEVTRKEVFLDPAQAQAALAGAGLA